MGDPGGREVLLGLTAAANTALTMGCCSSMSTGFKNVNDRPDEVKHPGTGPYYVYRFNPDQSDPMQGRACAGEARNSSQRSRWPCARSFPAGCRLR